MPIFYESKNSVVHTVMAGQIGLEEIYQHLSKLTNDSAVPSIFIERIDMTGVTKLELMSEDAQKIGNAAESLHNKHEKSVVVVIADSDFTYGITRMVQAYVEMCHPSVDWKTVKNIESADAIIEEVLKSMN